MKTWTVLLAGVLALGALDADAAPPPGRGARERPPLLR